MDALSGAQQRGVLTRAEIIAVGTELLATTRAETNSLFIIDHLEDLGIEVTSKTIVRDDLGALSSMVSEALARCDLLVLTGGLGPTDDDLTRDAVAKVFGLPLEEDLSIVKHMEARFARHGVPMPPNNRRQALVPKGAVVLDNANGTAPGLWIEIGDKVVTLLPGPPREMKPMFAALVAGRLGERSAPAHFARRVVSIAGRGESDVEERVRSLYTEWANRPVPIVVTSLASFGQVELHLTVRAESREIGGRVLEKAVEQVKAVLGKDLYSVDGESLEAVVGTRLRERGMRVAVAESCTAGGLAARLTNVAGSSDYFDRGVVVYSNSAKTELLGVPPELIAARGAVSDDVAIAMAEGMKARSEAQATVSVTGIAGPGGGTPEKPVGTVMIAVAMDGRETRVRSHLFPGDRAQVRGLATQFALDFLRRELERTP